MKYFYIIFFVCVGYMAVDIYRKSHEANNKGNDGNVVIINGVRYGDSDAVDCDKNETPIAVIDTKCIYQRK